VRVHRAIPAVLPATAPLVAPRAIIAILATLRGTVADLVEDLVSKNAAFSAIVFTQGGLLLCAYRLVVCAYNRSVRFDGVDY
jgi:hypothetical protein